MTHLDALYLNTRVAQTVLIWDHFCDFFPFMSENVYYYLLYVYVN